MFPSFGPSGDVELRFRGSFNRGGEPDIAAGVYVHPDGLDRPGRVARGSAREHGGVGARRLGDIRRGRGAGRATPTGASSRTDALGPTPTTTPGPARRSPGCHRSKSAEVHIGGGRLASTSRVLGRARPRATQRRQLQAGHRLLQRRRGNKGQALALQDVRGDPDQDIKAVVVLIGANDYGFADIVADLRDGLADVAVVVEELLPGRLEHHRDVHAIENIDKITNNVRPRSTASSEGDERRRLHRAQDRRSSPRRARRRIPQAARLPLPAQTGFTPPDASVGAACVEQGRRLGARHRRQHAQQHDPQRRQRACPNVKVLNMDARARSPAASCARTPSGCWRRRTSRPGQSPGAVDKSEWVHQIRTLDDALPPYQLQEDAHPNYWGQLALRNCFRQALQRGGGARLDVLAWPPGSTRSGEPNMILGWQCGDGRAWPIAALLLFVGLDLLRARAGGRAEAPQPCDGAMVRIDRHGRSATRRTIDDRRSSWYRPAAGDGPPLVAVEGGPGYPSHRQPLGSTAGSSGR